MERITSEEEMQKFRNRRALISVFVHHAYSNDLVRTVLEMRRGFDAHVQAAWDMLIPYNRGYAVSSQMNAEEYGVELARQLIRKHDLKHGELPALIFEFVPKLEYFCVKFGGMNANKIEEIIGTIGDMAVDEFEHGPQDVDEFRERLHIRVATYLNQQKLLSILSKAAPKLAGALGAVGDVKGLFH